MTFEKYLESNCGQRILDNLMKTDPENEDCTFPGRLLEELSCDPGHGSFCTPSGLEVERVYYRVKDMKSANCDECPAEEDDPGEGQHDLSFLLLFKVEFLTFRVDAISISGPPKKIRKYYANCTADIEDRTLRNFRMAGIHDRRVTTDLDIEMRRKKGEFSRYPVMVLTDGELEYRSDLFLGRYCPEALKEPMRVPVEDIFSRKLGLQLENDENRFTVICNACTRLWDGVAIKLQDLLEEKDGAPPFEDAMFRIMERNAKRTAAAILMPSMTLCSAVRQFLDGLYDRNDSESGSVLENMVEILADWYDVSRQAMKIRLENLGFDMFSGVKNYLDGQTVPAFFASARSQVKCGSYLIETDQLIHLLSEQPSLLALYDQGKVVYVEGKLAMNKDQYVQEVSGELTLTPYARMHVDECCIRFHSTYQNGKRQAAGMASIPDWILKGCLL